MHASTHPHFLYLHTLCPPGRPSSPTGCFHPSNKLCMQALDVALLRIESACVLNLIFRFTRTWQVCHPAHLCAGHAGVWDPQTSAENPSPGSAATPDAPSGWLSTSIPSNMLFPVWLQRTQPGLRRLSTHSPFNAHGCLHNCPTARARTCLRAP